MSRLADQEAACVEAQEILREVLPRLKQASRILAIKGGLCGTPPDSALSSLIRQVERLSQKSFQEILEWKNFEAGPL